MFKLIKVFFFATLIVSNLALADKAQVLVFAAASTKNALDAVIREYNIHKKTQILPGVLLLLFFYFLFWVHASP